MKPFSFLVCLTLLAAAVDASARAADLEHRTFSVTIDGKNAGDMKMDMQSLDDGTQIMAGQSALAVKRGNDPFRSSFRSLETWKNGHLEKYEAHCDDDDKKRHLLGNVQDAKFRVTVNGQRHDIAADVWTTSFWFVPTIPQKAVNVSLMDIETGKESAARLEYMGAETRSVMGVSLECSHYRVKGDQIQADLWYDGSDRLLRAETVTGGRKTVLDLVKVQK